MRICKGTIRGTLALIDKPLARLVVSALALLVGLRSRYPNATEPELRRGLADLLLGEELARKVYGEINSAE